MLVCCASNRAAKRNSRPFGGIQLIVTGDFFQLPPVNKNKKQPQDFCFKSAVWPQLFPEGKIAPHAQYICA